MSQWILDSEFARIVAGKSDFDYIHKNNKNKYINLYTLFRIIYKSDGMGDGNELSHTRLLLF